MNSATVNPLREAMLQARLQRIVTGVAGGLDCLDESQVRQRTQ